MAFRPFVSRNRWIAWLVAALLLLIILALPIQLLQTHLGPTTVVLFLIFLSMLALLLVVLYRLWALHRLDYWLDRDALRILWAGDRIDIPLPDIQEVETNPTGLVQSYRWWSWPVGWVQPLRPESVQVSYATRSPQESLALKTSYATFLISPEDSDGFVTALNERHALGPARKLEPTVAEPSYRQHWLIQDRWPLIVMATGLLFGLIFLGMLIWRYPTIPLQIPLHFDATGAPDRIGARRSIFLIPAITLLIGFFNAAIGIVLYERHKLASYMLWGSALLLQIVALIIVNRLLLTFA